MKLNEKNFKLVVVLHQKYVIKVRIMFTAHFRVLLPITEFGSHFDISKNKHFSGENNFYL